MLWASVRLGAGTQGRQVPDRMSMLHSVAMTSPSTFTSTRGSPVPSSLPAVLFLLEISAGQDVAGVTKYARFLLWENLGSSVQESPVEGQV